MADKDAQDLEPRVATEPEMSLEQAGAAFRGMLNAFRGMVVMGSAVQTALDAKHQLTMLERAKTQAVVAGEKAAATLADVNATLQQRVGEVSALDTKIKAAQDTLAGLNQEIAAAKRTQDTAQRDADAAHRKALADQDRELLKAQKRVQDAKDELAAVAGKYVTTEAP